MSHRQFLSLGSNLGNRVLLLQEAIKRIHSDAGSLVQISSCYETEPWGFISETPFLNLVVEIETTQTPEDLLETCLNIEDKLGRKRPLHPTGYAARPIDIDLLFYGQQIINHPKLSLPHPLLHLRNFILVPMNEIAPDFIHPVFKQPISALLENCPDHSEIYKFSEGPEIC